MPITEAEKVAKEETQAQRTSLEASENYAEVKTRIWTVAFPGEQHTSCRPAAGCHTTSRQSHQTTGARACCLPAQKPQSLHHKEPRPKIQNTPEKGPYLRISLTQWTRQNHFSPTQARRMHLSAHSSDGGSYSSLVGSDGSVGKDLLNVLTIHLKG